MSDEDTTRILNRKTPKSVNEADETVAYSSMQKSSVTDKKSSSSRDEDYTKVFRPSKPGEAAVGAPVQASAGFSGEPVVGWLVVVDGPGRGQSLPLGFGMNSIGRAKESRISLDFGDEEISRQDHASVVYDPKGNKFYLQHGGGINLTYIGQTPVLQPVEIRGRETISIGNTKLIFVPFCGPDFIW